MDLILQRHQLKSTGIFGSLASADEIVAVTLEHAFQNGDLWLPAIPEGVYTCQRGMHQLEGMKEPFETFEIMNVPGHTGILFHVGNYNRDSSGCVLLGSMIISDSAGDMITGSSKTFQKFMQLQAPVEMFQLTVENESQS